MIPPGKMLKIPGAATTNKNSKHRHQHQQPLGVKDPSAFSPLRKGPQKGDQVTSGSGVGQQIGSVRIKTASAWPIEKPCAGVTVGDGGLLNRMIWTYPDEPADPMERLHQQCQQQLLKRKRIYPFVAPRTQKVKISRSKS